MLSYERRHLPDNLWFHRRASGGGDGVGLVRRLYTAENGGSVSNSVVETNMFPFVLPGKETGSRVITPAMANLVSVFYFRVWGRINTTGTPTVTIRVKVGAVTFSLGPLAVAATAAGAWILDVPLFVRTAGFAGDVALNNARFFYAAGSDVFQITGSGSGAIDWTINNEIQISWQWGAADPANSAFFDSAVLEIIP